MKTHIINQISISHLIVFDDKVTANYPLQNLFYYHISIANNSSEEIQLLSRKWQLRLNIGEFKIIEGEGVVGLQPIIHPGEIFTYQSQTYTQANFSKMEGYYVFQILGSLDLITVQIPTLLLENPANLN